MLTIFLTEQLEQTAQEEEQGELIYYFCSQGDGDRRTAAAVLRGLLRQIVGKRPALARHALQYFETPAMTERHLRSLEALWVCFQKCIEDCELGLLWCIIDGLDECSGDDQEFLVGKLA